MRRRVPLIIGSTALVGLLLGFGAGSAAQTIEGLDLAKVRARAKLSPQDAEALSALLAKGVLGSAIFATDDLAATFERLRTAGAEVLQEPIDQPYGVRDCAFRDPAGNHLRFSQAL